MICYYARQNMATGEYYCSRQPYSSANVFENVYFGKRCCPFYEPKEGSEGPVIVKSDGVVGE